MNRPNASIPILNGRVPHMCGDEPMSPLATISQSPSSPHVWG